MEPVVRGARTFDLLMALAERRERAVAKNELLDLFWPGLVVEENNLQVQVSALRKLTGCWRDLELDGTLGLMLHHDRSSGHLLAVAAVPDLEGDEVTTTELAVDSKIEECEFADPVFHLKADSKCPDSPWA